MLQPTSEMYFRGASNSAGSRAGESCCRWEGRLGEIRSMQCPPQALSEGPTQTSAPSPFPAAQPSPGLKEAMTDMMTFAPSTSILPPSSLYAHRWESTTASRWMQQALPIRSLPPSVHRRDEHMTHQACWSQSLDWLAELEGLALYCPEKLAGREPEISVNQIFIPWGHSI
jgi:hypothetical protein